MSTCNHCLLLVLRQHYGTFILLKNETRVYLTKTKLQSWKIWENSLHMLSLRCLAFTCVIWPLEKSNTSSLCGERGDNVLNASTEFPYSQAPPISDFWLQARQISHLKSVKANCWAEPTAWTLVINVSICHCSISGDSLGMRL